VSEQNQKVKDLSDDDFVAKVLGKDETIANQVKSSEIDAEAIILKAKPSIDKYGVVTGVALAVARLREAILEANSEEVKGLLVGQRDRFGSNTPMRIPLISSTGNHMELINWGSSVKFGDEKIELPFPSVATVNILTEGDYKGVPTIRLVSISAHNEISVKDTVSRLSKVAKSVGELDSSDELRVTVVRGKISYVGAATKWKGKEKDGSWQIYVPNGKDNPVMHPVMQISLEAENGNQVRAVFERQRNAVPAIYATDFVELCTDAVASSSDPAEQAKFIGEAIKGREVILVGFITKVNAQANVTYIEMGAYALFDADASTQQETLSRGSSAQKGKGAAEKKPAPAAKKGKTSPVDKLKEKIRTYVELNGVSMDDIDAKGMFDYFKLDGIMEMGSVETAVEELRKE
jgi:hypothetical protein